MNHALTCLAAGLLFASAAHAAATTEAGDAGAAAEKMTREDWRARMSKLPRPEKRKSCFKAEYPKLEWLEVPCVKPPDKPYPPARGPRQPNTVGNGADFSAEVANTISSATGSFDSVSGVTSETGTTFGANCTSPVNGVADTYSLQLNTKPFTTTVCAASPNAGCQGWQQFIYSNAGSAFVQYWLLAYNTGCPTGWVTYNVPMSTDVDCYQNGNGVAVTPQTITNLANMTLTGSAASGGNDTIVMDPGTGGLNAVNSDNILNLATGWNGVEFIVCGDACSSQAVFNTGSTIVVRTTVHHGNTTAPSCVSEGFTGETNNLTLVGTTASTTGPAPAIVSTQSNSLPTVGSCVSATGLGDTHLTTFDGLLYDFQATGDFVLAHTDAFEVQTRQVSGAPTWPNASVNKAVATRMGKSRVALCLPAKLSVDGKGRAVADGKTVMLHDGVAISRAGNVYVISDQRGNSVRAEMNGTWINVSVGLGRWPENVHGLLANANGNVNQIAARDGTVFTNPLSFDDLYQRYGDSWRVSPKESLLSACGEGRRGHPKKPFYAGDLDPKVLERTRAVCKEAGVKVEALLEACALDVAVIGHKDAARVFAGLAAPVAVTRLAEAEKKK